MTRGGLLGLLVLLGCGCRGGGGAPPAAVQVDPTKATNDDRDSDDVAAAHARVLATFDAGDREAALEALRAHAKPVQAAMHEALLHGTQLANVTPLRLEELLPAAPSSPKAHRLVATRNKAPKGTRDALLSARGEWFREPDALLATTEQTTPKWLPPRIGDVPLHTVHPSDGRWVATWGERYLAVLGTTTTLYDFGAWGKTAGGEPASVLWAELAGDTLYVLANRRGAERFLAAIDARSGKVQWRSESGLFSQGFVVADRVIVAWKYSPSAAARGGELVTLQRETGAVTARRATPEIESGEGQLLALAGAIYCVASSELSGGRGLKHDEALELREAVTARAPAPAVPSEGPDHFPALPAPSNDLRAKAWGTLEGGDPRAAILALRPFLAERPTDLAAAALMEAGRRELAVARGEAAQKIVAEHPAVVAPDAPAGGRAPVPRTKTRKLKVLAQKRATMFADLPPPTDDELLPPAYVPDRIEGRARNQDAGTVTADYRVEVYWGYGLKSWSLVFREKDVVSVLEHPREVRAAGAMGEVLFTVNNAGSGPFFLEARDMKTGTLHYRAKDELHDQQFAVRDGYIIASTRPKPNVDIVLIEGDTGKVVDRAKLAPATQEAFLVFDRGDQLMAFNSSFSVTLALE